MFDFFSAMKVVLVRATSDPPSDATSPIVKALRLAYQEYDEILRLNKRRRSSTDDQSDEIDMSQRYVIFKITVNCIFA